VATVTPPKHQLDPRADLSRLSDDYPYEFRFIPHDELLIDAVDAAVGRFISSEALLRYQRQQDTVSKRIHKDGFQPLLFLPLVVNRRGKHLYAIGDGGGRYQAVNHWIEEGRLEADAVLPCLVCEIPVEDEPMWFVKLNREKLGLNQVDVFLAAAVSGDHQAQDILAIVREAGLDVSFNSKKKRIQAVDALRAIYGRGGETGRKDLQRTVNLLVASDYVDQAKGLTGAMIVGLGRIIQLHNPAHDDAYLLRVMHRMSPTVLHNEATGATAAGGGSRTLGRAIAFVLSGHINRITGARRGTKRWIDPEQFRVRDDEDRV
jgi:hypothetical protein